MNCGHWHYAPCNQCGIGVLTRQNGGHPVLCKQCKHQRKLEYNRQYNKIRIRRHGESCYTIINDPDPIAGFHAGAMLTKEEHLCMLKMCSYTPGTILLFQRGGKWIVCQTETIQKLKKCLSA